MSASADGRTEFLLNVRADVFKRLALNPVTDSTNPNHGFDYEHAYFELLRHHKGLRMNDESQMQDRTRTVDVNPGSATDVLDMVQVSSPIPSMARNSAKHPLKGNRVLDLTLVPEAVDCEEISKKGDKESTKSTRGIQEGAKRAKDAANSRGARTRNKPPVQLLARLNRAMAHPLYLVQRREGGRSFAIMGASGGVYSVEITDVPSCNCPDYLKRASGERSSFAGPCKHILFVMHRVLKVDQVDPALYQTRLTQTELERIFRDAPADPCSTVLAEDAVVRKFRESQDLEHRSNGVGSDCPICMDSFDQADKPVSVCSACDNCIHTTCMQMYLRAGVGRPKCPFCRSKWNPKAEDEGPLNLAKYSSKHAKPLSYAQLYPETHQFIGRSPKRKRDK